MLCRSVTSGGIRLRGIAPRQHSSDETSLQWRVVGDAVSDSTDPGFEPQTSRSDSNVFTTVSYLAGYCTFTVTIIFKIRNTVLLYCLGNSQISRNLILNLKQNFGPVSYVKHCPKFTVLVF